MLKVQETTVWPDSTPNHIYFLDDSKTKMFGYISALTQKEQWFVGLRGFDARNRKFTVLEKLPDPKNSAAKTWQVSDYTVAETDGKYTCSCKGFQFRGKCKHIDEVLTKSK